MFLSMLRRKLALFSTQKKLQPKNKKYGHIWQVYRKIHLMCNFVRSTVATEKEQQNFEFLNA